MGTEPATAAGARAADGPTPPATPESVSSAVRALQAEAMAANTRRAYAGDWARFAAWCARTGQAPLPAAPSVLAEYLTEAAGLVKEDGRWAYAPSTLTRWVAAVNRAHRDAGHLPPGDHQHVRAVLAGLRRRRARPSRRARALSLADLRTVLAAIPACGFPAGVIGARDATLLLVGFAGAFRRAELAGLTLGDVTRHGQDGLHLRLATSKTDQEAHGAVVAIPYGTRPLTCAACAYTRWARLVAAHDLEGRVGVLRTLHEVPPAQRSARSAGHVCRTDLPTPADPGAALFRPVTKAGRIMPRAISPDVVHTTLRRRMAAAGLDPTGYSAHSLRAGFVTEAFRVHAEPHAIMRQTRHTNPATLEVYAREHTPLAGNAVTRLGL